MLNYQRVSQKKLIEGKRKESIVVKLTGLAVLVAALAFAGPRPGDFRVLGPGGGGAQFNPTISPHDAKTVLVSCDMTGAYITRDAGESWRMFNLRGTVRFFAFDPVDPKTMYVQVTGLWRTNDGGDTWSLVYPKPSAIKHIQMADDHASERIVAEPDPIGTITALAIDPANSRILYVAGAKERSTALWVSANAGESWERLHDLPERAGKIWIAEDSPKNSRALYIAGASYVTRRVNGEWQQSSTPTKFTGISGGFQGRAGEPLIYGITDSEIYVSEDGGRKWTPRTLPGTGARFRAIAASVNNPKTAYVSYHRLKDNDGTWFGVAKTTDQGRTWTLGWKENNDKPAANVHDAWVTARFGPDWGENPINMGVAPGDADIAYGTDFGRTLRSTDGGETWEAVYSRKTEAGWTSTGLDVTTTYGYHFDPFDAKRQFITYTDIGLFRSEDGGHSWVSSTEGVPDRWVNTTYWVEFDPEVRGRMWGVMSYVHDLPRPKMFRGGGVERYNGGVCRSDDGGRTWKVTSKGMEPTAPTHILLDPTSPKDSRTLYVAAFGRGVYKSTDGGASWTLKNNGITQKEPFAWRLSRASDGTLYVIIARRSENGSIGDAGDGAIYKSTDGAEHWTPVPLPQGVNGPNGLAIDTKDDRRLYLAAWARAAGTHGEGGGIYLSGDGGENWKQVLDRDQHVYDVVADPRNPKRLYAAGFESSAWISDDRGEHWSRIPGYNFKWGHRAHARSRRSEQGLHNDLRRQRLARPHRRHVRHRCRHRHARDAAGEQSIRLLQTAILFVVAAGLYAENVVIRPKRIDAILTNPGMGIQTFQRFNGDPLNGGLSWSEEGPVAKIAQGSAPDFPATTISYCRWFWETLEPEKGHVRWEILDKALAEAAAHGQKLAIRLMPYDQKHPMPE